MGPSGGQCMLMNVCLRSRLPKQAPHISKKNMSSPSPYYNLLNPKDDLCEARFLLCICDVDRLHPLCIVQSALFGSYFDLISRACFRKHEGRTIAGSTGWADTSNMHADG